MLRHVPALLPAASLAQRTAGLLASLPAVKSNYLVGKATHARLLVLKDVSNHCALYTETATAKLSRNYVREVQQPLGTKNEKQQSEGLVQL